MSRATNRTSNISVTWNFKNPNISRNELINFIHLYLFREVSGYSREVSGYSRVLIRHYLAISATSRYLYSLEVFARRHFSIFIFHLSSDARPKVSRKAFLSESASSRKFPERLFSPSQRPPESIPTTPPEISRFLLPLDISTASQSSSGTISPFSSVASPKVSREAFLSDSASSRKFPERLFSPSQHPPESFLTTPPEISRFPFGTKVIKILDLSLYLQPTRPFTVSSTLSYSPKPVLHQPRHQTESTPLVHQSPCTFILISPCLTTTLISPVHHFPQLPSSLSRQFTLHCSPSVWQFRTRRAGNCTEFEAVSTYVTLKKITCIILRNLFGLYLFSSVMCHRHTPSSKTDLSSKIFS